MSIETPERAQTAKGQQSKLEAKYGLPETVKFCKKCVISNQRPNSHIEFKHTIESSKDTIHFDSDGICDACLVAEQKKKVDWEAREKELMALCDRFRGQGQYYDCLVPGSGGKDSFYVSHILKHKYGMRPLTVTWAPHMYTPWGWNNFQAWMKAGFDNYLMTPNGRVHRLLTRLAVENIFHPFQPFILGQKNLAPRMAAMFNIPLVFFGEDEAEYGNPKGDVETPQRDKNFFFHNQDQELFLGGEPVSRLIKDFGLEPYELDPYLPLRKEELSNIDIEVHYFGYYAKWHPQSNYYYAAQNSGFEASPERTAGTYSKYDSIDDKIDDFHYYTTFIKFGIGRATYDACQEIRSGDITREEGLALVKKYDGEYPDRFEKEIFEYLSIPKDEFAVASKQFKHPKMTREYFETLADQFRSPHLWKKENGEWKLRYKSFDA